jgi:hypothetical protein
MTMLINGMVELAWEDDAHRHRFGETSKVVFKLIAMMLASLVVGFCYGCNKMLGSYIAASQCVQLDLRMYLAGNLRRKKISERTFAI